MLISQMNALDLYGLFMLAFVMLYLANLGVRAMEREAAPLPRKLFWGAGLFGLVLLPAWFGFQALTG